LPLRLHFTLHTLSVDVARLSVQTPQAAVERVTKAPATRIAMFDKTQQSEANRLLNCLRANHELCRQLFCRPIVERHAISRSFANAASLSVSVKPSVPHASEFG